jgi:hypothetical protein
MCYTVFVIFKKARSGKVVRGVKITLNSEGKVIDDCLVGTKGSSRYTRWETDIIDIAIKRCWKKRFPCNLLDGVPTGFGKTDWE